MFKSGTEIVKKFVQKSEDKKTDFLKRENSNFIYGLSLLRKNISNHTEQSYLFQEIFPEKLVKKYTEGEIYIHDKSLSPYCNSTSCRDIALYGLPTTAKNMMASKPTDDFFYFTRHLSNAVTLMSQQVSGAVMLAGATTVLASYLYYEEKYKTKVRTDEEIYKYLRSLIWELNMPLRAGSESPFSNITLEFGKPSGELSDQYIVVGGNAINEKYGNIPVSYFDRINKTILNIMSKGAGKGAAFTFPLLTVPIDDDFDWDNDIFTYSLEKMYDWGGMYFENFQTKPFRPGYYSELNPKIKARDPNISRSLCPLDGNEKVLYYSEKNRKLYSEKISVVYKNFQRTKHNSLKTLSNGELLNVKVNKFEVGKERYKIVLANNSTLITTADHLNLVYGQKKEIKSIDLTTKNYLPFSRKAMPGKGLDYDDGLIVGCFLGNGSFTNDKTCTFSVNKKSKKEIYEKLKILIVEKFGGYVTEYDCISTITGKNSCVNLRGTSDILIALIKQCVNGTDALSKEIDNFCFNKSLDFRKGIIDGLYQTDGGNNNRIYTSSKKLVNSLTILCMTLGIPVNVTEDNRDNQLSSNTCYTIRLYNVNNFKNYKNIYFTDDEYVWFKIKSIEKIQSKSDFGYCFEVLDNSNPVFSISNGIVTHNCRLQIDLELLSQSSGGVFGSSVSNVGAVQVLNLNINRVALKYKNNEKKFFELIREDLELMQEGHQRKRKWLEDHKELYPTFFSFNQDLKNYFNVFAITGMHEAMLTFGYENGLINQAAKIHAHRIMQFISKIVDDFIKRDSVACGIEYAPAENASIKMARDDIKFARIMRKRTFFQGTIENPFLTAGCMLPFSESNMIEVIENHAEFQAYATSGSIFHNFLEDRLPPEQLKTYIKRVFSKPINYMTLTPTRTVCNDCGHAVIKDIPGQHCENCGSDDLSVWSRVIGYYKPVARKDLKIEQGSYEGKYNFWSNAKRIDWASRNKLTKEKYEDLVS